MGSRIYINMKKEKFVKKTSLDKLKAGDSCVVKEIKILDSTLFRKIIDMGIVSGTSIKVVKSIPFDGPIIIELFGYELCIRKNISKNILVEVMA